MTASFARLACAGLFALLAAAAGAAEPQSATAKTGVIRSTGLPCFKAAGPVVAEVCGTWAVHWRLDTLMGDPLSNFHLEWQAREVLLRTQGGKGATVRRVIDASLGPELSKAAHRSELYLQAEANLPQLTPTARLPFNTGVAVRSNGGKSMNVASGSNWDDFLLAGTGWQNPRCEPAAQRYLPAAEAKQVYRHLLTLGNDLTLCPGTQLDASPLEEAIGSWCQQHATDPLCPKPEAKAEAKPPAPPANKGIEDAFTAAANQAKGRDKPGAAPTGFAELEAAEAKRAPAPAKDMAGAFEQAAEQRRKEVERLARLEAATRTCSAAKTRQDECLQRSCKAEPRRQICTREELLPHSPCECKGENCACLRIPQYRCVAEGPNPAHAAWRQCTEEAARACVPDGQRIDSVQRCAEAAAKAAEPPG